MMPDATPFFDGAVHLTGRCSRLGTVAVAAALARRKYMRWADASANNRGRMLELRAFQKLAMGLTQLAAHVVSRPPRGLHRYGSDAVIREIADLA